MDWITLNRDTGDAAGPSLTSLLIDKALAPAGKMTVVGVLPHGCAIEPATVEDAEDLIAWLSEWARIKRIAAVAHDNGLDPDIDYSG